MPYVLKNKNGNYFRYADKYNKNLKDAAIYNNKSRAKGEASYYAPAINKWKVIEVKIVEVE